MAVTKNYTTFNSKAIVLKSFRPPQSSSNTLGYSLFTSQSSPVEKAYLSLAYYNGSETSLQNYTRNYSSIKKITRLATRTLESFPAYYKVLGKSRKTRIFPPLKDV